MTPSRPALREATHVEHERLDALFGGFDLGNAASYAAFLSAHAAALLPIEAALDAAGAGRIVDDWPLRRRGSLLIADLAALGRGVPAAIPAPRLDGDAAIAGALYVVEGSRLGGKLLARQVAAGLPHRYLDPDQPSGSWGKMLAQIDAVLYDADALSQAIEAARDVFAAFESAGRVCLREVKSIG